MKNAEFGITWTNTGFRQTTFAEYKAHQIKIIKGWLQRSRDLHSAGYTNRAHFWLNAASHKRQALAKLTVA